MSFANLKQALASDRKTWLVTGAAGFIGSHLVESLLHLNQQVIGIDNFSSGSRQNLVAIETTVDAECYAHHFSLVEADIRNFETCQTVCRDVDYVLHHAALSSVPLSVENPLDSYASNVTGSLTWSNRLIPPS